MRLTSTNEKKFHQVKIGYSSYRHHCVVYSYLYALVIIILIDNVHGTCRSPQYVELGESATIKCDFDINTYNVYWYKREQDINPFIRYEYGSDPPISGSGFDTASYSVSGKGSLIIFDVTMDNERTYKVLAYNRNDDISETHFVDVHTYDNVHGTCQSPQYVELGESATIKCDFDINTYNVYWYKREQDINPFIRYEYGSDPPISGSGFDTASYSVSGKGSLIIFDVTMDNERTYKVLAYNRNDDISETHFVDVHTYDNVHGTCQSPQYVELGESATIKCDFDINTYNVYWYKREQDINPFIRYEYGSDPPISGSGFDTASYSVSGKGSLIIFDVTMDNERTYKVLAYNRNDDISETHFVDVHTYDNVHGTCQSPQYVELGESATIKCDFDINTCNVYWYKREQDINPFIRYEYGSDPPISGSGLDTASYSVSGKGSLIIFDVTMDNERTYKVLAYNRNDDISETHFVDVHTYDNVHGTCRSPQYVELGESATIKCDFDINTCNVYWYKREQDINPFIRYEYGSDPPISGSGFDTASYSVSGKGSLIIFDVTMDNERTYKVLAYNRNDDISETHFVDVHTYDNVHGTCQSPQYVELGESATIKCDFDINTCNVYWYKREQDINPFIRYEYGSDPPISGSGFDTASYSVSGKGSLIIFDVTMDNERTYKVLAYNRNDDISETHFVDVHTYDNVHGTCQSPQYVELGESATIKCDFDINTCNVYWYKREQDINPFIRYEYGSDPPISGSGLDTASYSVSGKGSLIIFDVTMDNERTYKVLAYNRNDDISETHFVDVHTYAKCEQAFPLIKYCTNQSTCLVDSDSINGLGCSFGCSIPTAELRWYVKRGDQEETITGNHTEESDGTDYISISNIEINQYLKEPLTQLVCELRGPTTHVLQSSIFLDQSNTWMYIGDRPTPKYYQINSQSILTCAENVVPSIVIWERTSAENSTEVIQFSEGGRTHSSLSSRWHVNERGALILHQVDFTSEGIYRCKFFDGEKFGAYEQSVTVLVSPSPPFLLVDGCPQTTQPCSVNIMAATSYHSVTCYVNEVYPNLSLSLENEFADEMAIWNLSSVTVSRNDRYYASASAELQLLDSFSCNDEHFIICRAIGAGASAMVNPEKKIKISWERCSLDTSTETMDTNLKWMQQNDVIIVLVLSLVVCLLIITICLWRIKKIWQRRHYYGAVASSARVV
ncbi:uncharacterized protein [Apostichopus japonicus]|uniref:uncharacterized protein n=1 Tax=Stichopus japonicus TaxID=307972 RepID=UPI003AB5AE00